jgi:hypothetical protein
MSCSCGRFGARLQVQGPNGPRLTWLVDPSPSRLASSEPARSNECLPDRLPPLGQRRRFAAGVTRGAWTLTCSPGRGGSMPSIEQSSIAPHPPRRCAFSCASGRRPLGQSRTSSAARPTAMPSNCLALRLRSAGASCQTSGRARRHPPARCRAASHRWGSALAGASGAWGFESAGDLNHSPTLVLTDSLALDSSVTDDRGV